MKCHYCVEARDLDTEYCYHWWLEDVACLAWLIIDNFTRLGHQICGRSSYLQHLPPFWCLLPMGRPRLSTFIRPWAPSSSLRSFWSWNLVKIIFWPRENQQSCVYLFGLEHQLGDCPEHLLHVDIVLGGRLEQSDPHLVCKPPGVLRQHNLRSRWWTFEGRLFCCIWRIMIRFKGWRIKERPSDIKKNELWIINNNMMF